MAAMVALLAPPAAAALPGGTQDPTAIPKYQVPLVIPPAMPRTLPKNNVKGNKAFDYYEIAVQQFEQQILPPGMPDTTVWSYGSINHPWSFNYPAFTIEAKYNKPVRIKWINDLVDDEGNYLPHLFPVDQTLHWANPDGTCADGTQHSDCGGLDQHPYIGPVPMITHLHGAHTAPQYDGYPEAWYLPALDIPAQPTFTEGSLYDYFSGRAAVEDGIGWGPGYAVFQYPNDQNATTLWYHDHTLGMTRLNVYAGMAGFYLLRDGPGDAKNWTLPGPAPKPEDLPGMRYYEIPIVIQDRSFNADGSLFYPDHRAFAEGLLPSELDIPLFPNLAQSGLSSDVAPIWNPEFFGNTMVVNGGTWPYLEVEPRRYRFRLLNGSQGRFLILATDHDLPIWQIGSDGGFLPEPVESLEVRLGPAERADVVIDFGELPVGATVTLLNLGPDHPFQDGEPDLDFVAADPATTGQVMQFRVVAPEKGAPDISADPALGELILPTIAPLAVADNLAPRRTLSLHEFDSETVLVEEQADGSIVEVADLGTPFGPIVAMVGTHDPLTDASQSLKWIDPLTENPALGSTEIWEIHNFTQDAHPIHIHQVQFEVVNREPLFGDAVPLAPEWWEEGLKDTVMAYPGRITRIKAKFDLPGLYTWHCHILEHEDNEMMRPFHVGPIPNDLPVAH